MRIQTWNWIGVCVCVCWMSPLSYNAILNLAVNQITLHHTSWKKHTRLFFCHGGGLLLTFVFKWPSRKPLHQHLIEFYLCTLIVTGCCLVSWQRDWYLDIWSPWCWQILTHTLAFISTPGHLPLTFTNDSNCWWPLPFHRTMHTCAHMSKVNCMAIRCSPAYLRLIHPLLAYKPTETHSIPTGNVDIDTYKNKNKNNTLHLYLWIYCYNNNNTNL